MSTPAVNPLTARCGWCAARPGQPCKDRRGGFAREPHARRVRLARAFAAHADPALEAIPSNGPCGLCGTGLPQRHRVVDAIAGMLAAGEDPEIVAEEYGVSAEAVATVQAWAERWPGAWQ